MRSPKTRGYGSDICPLLKLTLSLGFTSLVVGVLVGVLMAAAPTGQAAIRPRTARNKVICMPSQSSASMVVVLNSFEELNARVPTNSVGLTDDACRSRF